MQFDAASQVGAIIREVVDREHDGLPARVVIAERRYETGIDDLWDALTNPDRIPRWFSPVTGEFRLGGRYQVEGNAGGTVTACEPPRRLALSWEFGGQTSWVTVALSEAGPEVSRLVLEHIAPITPEFAGFWEQFGPGAVGVGWDLGLLGLALHVEMSADKAPETDKTFHKTPDGREFIEGSSAGWGQASRTFGTDKSIAQDATKRTTAFYFGETPAGG